MAAVCRRPRRPAGCPCRAGVSARSSTSDRHGRPPWRRRRGRRRHRRRVAGIRKVLVVDVLVVVLGPRLAVGVVLLAGWRARRPLRPRPPPEERAADARRCPATPPPARPCRCCSRRPPRRPRSSAPRSRPPGWRQRALMPPRERRPRPTRPPARRAWRRARAARARPVAGTGLAPGTAGLAAGGLGTGGLGTGWATTRPGCGASVRSGARPAHSRRRFTSRACEKYSADSTASPSDRGQSRVGPDLLDDLHRKFRTLVPARAV